MYPGCEGSNVALIHNYDTATSLDDHYDHKITVTVQPSGTKYAPTHYKHLLYDEHTWTHRHWTFNRGSWSSDPTTAYANAEIIIAAGGKSIRLHEGIKWNNVMTGVRKLTTPSTDNFYLRSDVTLNVPADVTVTDAPDPYTHALAVIDNDSKGLGFWQGSGHPVTLRKGYLFLGPNITETATGNFVVNATGNVFIENYWRSDDTHEGVSCPSGIASHELAVNFTPFGTLNNANGGTNNLYVSNSNNCMAIRFYKAFNPTAIGAGNISIGVHGANTGGNPGRGIVNFKAPVTFGTAGDQVTTGNVKIHGSNVMFTDNATYNYYASGGLHEIKAGGNGGTDICTDCHGDILFQGGAVVVNKSGNTGATEWTANGHIETAANSTVTNTTSGIVPTTWQTTTGYIHTNDNVTFNNEGTGTVLWNAATNILTSGGSGSHPHVLFNTTGDAETKWIAENNIYTENSVTFINEGTQLTSWTATTGDIITGYDPNNNTPSHNAGMVGRVEFINKNTTGTPNTTWTAENNIITNAHVRFENHTKGNTTWTATKESITINDSTTFVNTNTSTGNNTWIAKKNITTNDTILFDNAGTGNTLWHAEEGHIITNRGAELGNQGFVNFNSTGITGSRTDWVAYTYIQTNNVVHFKNEAPATIAGIKWNAKTGRIEVNDSTTFEQLGSTIAGATLRNVSADQTVPAGALWLLAATDFWTEQNNKIGEEHPLIINFGADNNAALMIHAVGASPSTGTIQTDGVVHIDRQNRGASETTLEAKTDIHILDTFTHNDRSAGDILLHAQKNILINCSSCEDYNSAPTTFAADGAANTRWIAGNNIHTRDFVNFNYGPATTPTRGTIRNLDFVAQNGNITTDRSFKINSFDGNSQILFSAVGNMGSPFAYTDVSGVQRSGTRTIQENNNNMARPEILKQGQDDGNEHTDNDREILKQGQDDIEEHTTDYDGTGDPGSSPGMTGIKGSTPYTGTIGKDIPLSYNGNTGNDIPLSYNGNTGNDELSTDKQEILKQGQDDGNGHTANNREILKQVQDDMLWHTTSQQKVGTKASNKQGNDINQNVIDFNDSVVIVRNNPGAGTTNIIAKNRIRTAALKYIDYSTGNNTTVESLLGDLYLGYAMKPDYCNAPNTRTSYSYDRNVLSYQNLNPAHSGILEVKSGFENIDEKDLYADGNGGNIYLTHFDFYGAKNGNSSAEFKIPYTKTFVCTQLGYINDARDDINSPERKAYEHSGIIAGIPCGWNVSDWLEGYVPPMMTDNSISDVSLVHNGNNGTLLLDAGTRGNILINRGAELNFKQNTGNALFITRYGNIDFRNPFDVDSMAGSLLILAASELPNRLQTGQCNCEEQKNNVYIQDLSYTPHVNSGSVFIGADNNIKLQYGGLRTTTAAREPFFSPNGDQGYPCPGGSFHCNSDPTVNKARNLIFNFRSEANGKPVTSGGVAMVASDLIDIYKPMTYVGGEGAGLSTVPNYSTLHGESVAGYGLYIKVQANKNNWEASQFDAAGNVNPEYKCTPEVDCLHSYLHSVARVTFHAAGRIITEDQKALIASPTLETFGPLELNTAQNAGSKSNITLRADSLILHDSLIIDGPETDFSAWSNLKRNMPIVKIGHHRFTPSYEDGDCKSCYAHTSDPLRKNDARAPLDTIHITYRNGGDMPRLNSLVLDHATISFLTDSFDRQLGSPTTDAKIFSDMVKVRNHVELYTDPDRTRTGHFELVSEPQMSSKDFAGIYTRHLHMEPEAPACSDFKYSQLWTGSPTLEVITTSTLGGYGWIHADVYVEIDAMIAPGYTSLKDQGTCDEHGPGILKMNDLRMDRGAQIEFSLGNDTALFYETHPVNGDVHQLGKFADLIDVDSMTLRGELVINLMVRPDGLSLAPGDAMCFPLIRYEKVGENDLRNIRLAKNSLTEEDHPDIKTTYRLSLAIDTAAHLVSVCVTTDILRPLMHSIYVPEVDGVQHYRPEFGVHWVTVHNSFAFALTFFTDEPLAVVTNRVIAGIPEGEIFGNKNQNGEYEYILRNVMQDVIVTIGPGFASIPAPPIPGGILDPYKQHNVWTHKNTLYVKVHKHDVASVYSIAGQLVKKIELNEGNTSIPLVRGVYVVTLKDGTVHKIIIQ
jgi:hypothetical protein